MAFAIWGTKTGLIIDERVKMISEPVLCKVQKVDEGGYGFAETEKSESIYFRKDKRSSVKPHPEKPTEWLSYEYQAGEMPDVGSKIYICISKDTPKKDKSRSAQRWIPQTLFEDVAIPAAAEAS